MPEPADPFFIVGVQRSGTTLLSVLLNNHPALYVGRRATVQTFFTTFEQNRLPWTADLRHASPDEYALSALRAGPRLRALCAGLEPAPAEGLSAFLRRACAVRAQEQGKTVWGDKAVGELEYVPGLHFYFPTARFIHLLRDGRAVAQSLRDRQQVPLRLGMHSWKRQIANGRMHGAFLGSEQYIEVTYEALVRDPATELARLCAFLGVPFDAAMLDLEAASATQKPGAYVRDHFDASRSEAWAAALSTKEIGTLEALGGDLLQQLGYPLRVHPPEGPFRSLSPLGFVWQNQRRHFRALTMGRKKVMREQRIVEVKTPLRKRLKRFLVATVRLWLNPRVAHHLRRRRPMV